MTYSETLDYLFTQLPMYQREGKAAYKVNLNNTLRLDEHLGQPHKSYKSIHVGGTNGKGSSSYMLSSILQEAGYKVGLYTSPHLKDFRERIKINGKEISEEYVCEFVLRHKSVFESWNLSFFEWTVGLCFDYFKSQKVDIAIIEVGLGGRLDSTNIITPIASLITNIGLDHQQFLGDTIKKIAIEKAGIIKSNVPIVISETHPETSQVFKNKANEMGSPIYFADKKITTSYPSDLKGSYQAINQKGILAIIEILEKQEFNITSEHVQNGLKKVVSNTGLKGRWQTLNTSPLTLCDTAHNFEGLFYVIKQLQEVPKNNLHLVLGFVNDKSVSKILALFPNDAQYYLCEPSIPRSLPIDDLSSLAAEAHLKFESFKTVTEAVVAAKTRAESNDVVFIGGSTFVVAEVV